jgi:quinol monooxygenase YgiN
MTSAIRVHAVHSVREEHGDEFKTMVTAMVEKVRAGEPGYLSYELFLSDDERTCHVVGLLEDSDAVMAHLTGAADTIGRFSELAPSTRIEIFGDVSDELRQLVAPFGAEIVGHWAGFTR